MQHYKIVFGGSMGAGKTKAISVLSDIDVIKTEALNTDKNSHQKELTTVGMDYGEINIDDTTKISLYGSPGQSRFSFIWPVLSKGALRTIILIDHSSPDPLSHLAFYLDAFKLTSENAVIGITHVDMKPALPISIYREWLQKNDFNCPLFVIDVRNRNEVLLLIECIIASCEVNFTGEY